jgi:hypothetical protein
VLCSWTTQIPVHYRIYQLPSPAGQGGIRIDLRIPSPVQFSLCDWCEQDQEHLDLPSDTRFTGALAGQLGGRRSCVAPHCTYPSSLLTDFVNSDEIYREINRDFNDGQFALPVLRSFVMGRFHEEHVEHLRGRRGVWTSRSTYEKWSLLSGYVQHESLGPVYMPREWLAAKFGLDLTDLSRLNAGFPCPKGGWCATKGELHCDNCALIASGLGQAWHRPTYAGEYKRLFALWLAGHASGQHNSEGHTLPVHICGTACTHKRNAPLTHAAEALVKRRRRLEDVPPGFKVSKLKEVFNC